MAPETETRFIDLIAGEMATAVCEAVGYWMADIDSILANQNCSPEQKLDEIAWLLTEYKSASQKQNLHPRPVSFKAAGASSAHDGI